MDMQLNENATFEGIDYSEQELFSAEYIKCEFVNCDFSKTNLKKSDLIDCTFKGCNFSLTLLEQTGLKNVQFQSCKLMGVNFTVSSSFLFSVSFQDCHLDYSSFFQKKMPKTTFTNCSLKEVDFEEADLSMAVFKNCDLMGAHFIRTNMEKADLRTAVNYTLDPEVNKMKKARFSYMGIAGLLAKYDIDIEYP
jgi:fluoroquinolone resistance protein